ncbi:Bone morphoproteintic protein 1 [Sparganum proliferum]
MLIALFLASDLATASVVRQHLGKPTSDTDADKSNAPSGFVQPQTGGRYADPDGSPRDSTYPVQSEPQNMAEEKSAETSYLSLPQAAGFIGDAALTDSDVESVLPSDIGSELHSLRANEQTFGDVPESNLDGGWDQNVNKLVGSDDTTDQTLKQQQNYSSQILAGEGQGPNGVKAALLSSSSSSSSSSSKGLYAAGASEGEPLRRSRRAAISLQRALWPSGIVPYEIRSIFSTTIIKGMRAWENISCVTFVQREPHHHTYLIFTILRCGCCSHVGLKCTGSPQAISIAPSCESVGEVMHQLGHVLGFYHEQSRPDRDDFVEILSDNILPGAWNEFAKRPSTYIDSLGEPYDYESIMHLKNNEFTKPGKNESIRPLECCPPPKIGQRVKISEGDIRQVNKLYKCPSCGWTLLERSGTFASPQVEPLRPTTEASDRQHELEMPREEFDDSQELAETASEDAKTTPEMPSTITPSTQSQAQNSTSGRYCGTNLPPTLLSSNMRMLVEYTRPAGQSGTGFVANYRVECGYTMTGDKGSFFSPYYESDRFPNDICIWRIRFPVGFYVFLKIHNFQINETEGCLYNYLEVFDGPSESSPSLYKLCGFESPERIFSSGNAMTIHLVLNGSLARQGFLALYEKVAECGEYLKADQGTFTSPKYPNWCPPNLKCDWKIEVPVGFSINLLLRGSLNLEQSRCKYEYIEVYDGPSRSSPMLQKLCGHDLPTTLGSTNNTMTLRFVSGGRKEERTLEGSFIKEADCGGNLIGEQGNFTSPGYPSKYPPNFKCVWKIEVPVEFSVVLTFDSFDLEWQWHCERDYIEIFDGPLESSPLLGKLCGSDIPAPINSTTNTMTVRFITDRSRQEKGFAATFKKATASSSHRVF